MFKAFRIFVLLVILAVVGGTALMQRWQAQSWRRTQVITVYPINVDGNPATDAYLDQLDQLEQRGDSAFADIAPYFQAEARRYGLALSQPVQVVLGRRVRELPPPVPREAGMLSAMGWSLKMRWWAWRKTPPSSPVPDVRLYLLYHPGDFNGPLPHSTGMEKGRMGLVHLFASRAQQGPNQVVIAHEALHTFGATDKYDPGTLMPTFPEGYAAPDQQPTLPQDQAELMAGRIPVRPGEARIPAHLGQTVIGRRTAEEINWIKR
ncbi:hypothetical protein SAMN05216359_103198 [Roseateles sp. YR242]|uniref:hypothetical protein n=1 Tax=Roseateles sp. YR242 TaxID=1855305 RepID=UPI0008C8C424|nr:hypothetical protein [Roseateles sp. YR242]SEK81732.1 hypothetical protein SAMN05216359_103198 [Roseateles sp. YR242]